MSKAGFFSLIILGLTSIVAQLTVIREAIISFYGNEIILGLVLSFWLIWTAVGAITLAGFFNRLSALKILVYCHFFIPLVFIVEIILLRAARLFLPTAGQSLDPILGSGYLALVVAPLCLLIGLQFAATGRFLLGSGMNEPNIINRFFQWVRDKLFSKKQNNPTNLVNRSYFYEVLGLVSGGIIYSVVFARLRSFEIFLFLLILNYVILFFMTSSFKRRLFLTLFLILVAIIYVIPGLLGGFIRQTESWRLDGQAFIKSVNSASGNISISQRANQYNFYENGLFVGSTQKDISAEEIVHLPMLYSQNPKNIMLIGGGFSGALLEISKYPVDKIDYLEIDYKLVETIRPYLEAETKYNEKINFIFDDAFHYLKNSQNAYDVIIVNLPAPFTLQLNRFYSTDFFELARINLNEGGVFALKLSAPQTNFSLEFEELSNSIYKSLDRVYFSSIVLPAKNLLYLASDSALDYNIETLQSRLKKYNLKNQLVNADYLDYRLENVKVSQALEKFKQANSTMINSGNSPAAYWQQNFFWLSAYYPKLAAYLKFFGNFTLPRLILISFILFFALHYILDVLIKKRERILVVITTVPEFSLFAAEIAFIFLFQIIYGNLYYRLSLIFTMVFLGIAAGVWLANGLMAKNKIKYCHLFRLYFFFGLYFIFLVLLFNFYPGALKQPVFFYWLVFAAGIFAGAEFPIVNKYYLRDKHEPAKKTATIYAANLIGSSLGALFATIFLLPVLGFSQTLIFLAFLNFLAFAALFFLRQNFEDS